MSDKDGLISRWSKRKRAAATEESEPARDPAESARDENAAEDTAPPSEESEEEILARFNLPDPENLGPGDDFKGFMQAGVPEALRRRALRKLWTSNPVLANLDGLNDYDEDFTSPEETAAVLKTAYKVGRGFVKDLMDGSEKEGAPEAGEPDVEGPSTEAKAAVTPERAEPAEESQARTAPPMPEDDHDQASPPRPRRMRFET